MTTTIQIKANGASAYSEVEKKDFLGALEDCDSVNDKIIINGTTYILSTVILCDCDSTTTLGSTTTSTVADVYEATGDAGPIVLTTGLRVALNVNETNTGASTVDYDGTGAIAIELDGAALTGGELVTGLRYPLVYNGTSFQLSTNASTSESKFTIKGNLDCSLNPDYPAAEVGDAYRVTVAGKIGGGAGRNVVVGDILVSWAVTDSGDQATVGVNWTIEQDELDPASVSDMTTATNQLKYATPYGVSAAIQKGYNPYIEIVSGVADVYVGDSSIASKAQKVGERYRVLIDVNNAGGPATLQIGATAAAYPLRRRLGNPAANSLVAGQAYIVVFRGTFYEISTVLNVNSITGDDTLETSDKYATYAAAKLCAVSRDEIVNEDKKKYKALLTQATPATLVAGPLLVGAIYTLTAFVAGDDFSNMELLTGQVNTNGSTFRATSDTPTVYANGSTIDYGGEPYVVSTDANGDFVPFINTVGNLVWSYTGVGEFVGTLAGAFPDQSKVFFNQPPNWTGGSNLVQPYFGLGWTDANSIYLTSADLKAAGVAADDLLNFTTIEFEINA